ncbi:hypothetical protein TthAA22_23320 (plasmid) [Thermus thermophilus]|uniref:Uncharacterized protein n=1 Tax=Thermus thermophilus TaxID=274 RepID=A0AAD1NZ79_THETH|nr:hypothetical protein TthAA220_22060 [Thermus thermophilus]BBL85690.1 hypothetical protein TthAA229_21710 [Thermus thermophilus]BCZ88104.1 hypothetical protein TthAA11_22860 [Thermus thermophilus]BCZ90527.1 hypothetical protein TthAA22_23320 [Thermus thermophilus]
MEGRYGSAKGQGGRPAPLAPGRRWEMRRTRKHLEEMAQAARALALYAEDLHARDLVSRL